MVGIYFFKKKIRSHILCLISLLVHIIAINNFPLQSLWFKTFHFGPYGPLQTTNEWHSQIESYMYLYIPSVLISFECSQQFVAVNNLSNHLKLSVD